MYSPAKAAKLLGVCTKTIHRWDKAGRIKTFRTPTNQRRIPESEIRRIRGLKENSLRCAVYARVSTQKQLKDGNLQRQKERLVSAVKEKGYNLVSVVSEQASGLNENRRGLKKLFKLASKNEIDVVLVEFKDRLARFGYSYIEEVFKTHGVKIELLEQKETQDATQELVQDMMAIIAVFAARLYGARSKKFRQKVKQAMREVMTYGPGQKSDENIF